MNYLRAAVGLGLLVLLAACASLTEENGEIRGVVTYRQRIAMPPDAVLLLELVDLTVSEDDPPVLASRRIEKPGNVPVFYEFSYPPALLRSGHRLAMHARILSGGRSWMVTEKVNHVMANGRIARADVSLKPAK